MNDRYLLSNDGIVFTTREFAIANSVSVSAASRRLATLRENGSILVLTRGIWANTGHPYFSPLSCIPKLLGVEQGYLSFLSALHLHGLLSQIPATIQIATTGRSRTLKTPVGMYEFFQIKPTLMLQDIYWSESRVPYRIASAEKCLFDTFYIATRKGRRFLKIPEIEVDSKVLSIRRFDSLINRLRLPIGIKVAVNKRASALFDRAE